VPAALASERVLPFASGDSRKRGPGRVGIERSQRIAAEERRKASGRE
jgi:hypothetical protein